MNRLLILIDSDTLFSYPMKSVGPARLKEKEGQKKVRTGELAEIWRKSWRTCLEHIVEPTK